jgi:hypothetical protein
MNRSLSVVLLLTISAVVFVGCNNTPPDVVNQKPGMPPTDDWSTPKSLMVTDPVELAAVTEMEKDRANYKYCLQVLAAYYHKFGNLDKETWANSEYKNLSEAKMFQWENVPEITMPTGESVDSADERLLVERTVAAREKYIADTDNVANVLAAKSDSYKLKVIRTMQARLDPICLYPYFPESMLPPRYLRPNAQIPAADRLYQEGVQLFQEGKGWAHTFVTTSYPKERQACVRFMKLIHDYPQSTKIAMAAYYIAEINKEYFKENTLAVYWYERAWTWDPHITEPARFQAATVYDFHLHNYSKAVECYRLALKYDPYRWRNPSECEERIKALTGQ